MSFTGGGAASSGGFTGTTPTQVGYVGRQSRNVATLTPKEKISDLETISEDLKDKTDEIEGLIDDLDLRDPDDEHADTLDDFGDEVLDKLGIDETDDLDLDPLAELISRLQLIDSIEAISQAERRDFVFRSLDEFGINPFDDDAKLEDISFDEVRKTLGESIATEWNDVMDGFGKIAEGLGKDSSVFGDLEAYSDVARAIISGDPKYLEQAVLEKLGVEFDEDGNFSLKDTLSDNLSPVFGRMFFKKVAQPLSKKISEYMGITLGETLVDTEAMAESIAATTEVREFESLLARTMAGTLGQEFGEGAAFLFEGAAPLFAVVGALQATGALTRIISSVLRKANMKRDAYVAENHQWFGTKPQWDWIRYTGPLYDAISGIAELTGDILDRQDYVVGETPRQRYEQKKELHNFAFRIYEDVIDQISDPDFKGALNFSEILKEAREYPTVANNQYFRLSAIEMATDMKFFLQDILDGTFHQETPLRSTVGNPIYRGLDTIDAKDLSVNEYVNEYNIQVIEDELQMYKDFRDKIEAAALDENVYDEDGRNIPEIEEEIRDLQEMIRRRNSNAVGDILATQYHYSMPGGGQQRTKDQNDLKALNEALEVLEDVKTERLNEARTLMGQEEKVRNTLEKLGVSGYVKTDAQYRQMYDDTLEERGRELVEVPLRFEAYKQFKEDYGDRFSDDQYRKWAGYGQYRNAAERLPLTGTGSDTILSTIGMSNADYQERLEEALDLTFDSWMDDYFENLQTL